MVDVLYSVVDVNLFILAADFAPLRDKNKKVKVLKIFIVQVQVTSSGPLPVHLNE